MNSWPIAHTVYNDEIMKIYDAVVVPDDAEGEFGEILGYEKNSGLKIKCGEGCILAREIQFPGSKRMSVDDYMKGHSLEIGAILN